MAAQAEKLGPDGAIVQSITLFAVLVYEIVGPFLTKVALTKAGDIKPEGKTSARHEAALAMEKSAAAEVQAATESESVAKTQIVQQTQTASSEEIKQ